MHADDWSDLPAFAQLYGCGVVDEGDQDSAPISRRMAFYLWSTACDLHATWLDVAADSAGTGIRSLHIDQRPPAAQRHATDVWLTRFAQCFSDVASRLARAEFSDYGVAACTGDEVAALMVVELARALLSDG